MANQRKNYRSIITDTLSLRHTYLNVKINMPVRKYARDEVQFFEGHLSDVIELFFIKRRQF